MVIRKLGFTHWIRVEACGYAGGIWLMWNEDNHRVEYLCSNEQLIHCKVTAKASGTCHLMESLYGDPNPGFRVKLWESLRSLATGIRDPWLILGDFNAYMEEDDKKEERERTGEL